MEVVTFKNQDYVVVKNFNGMYFEDDYIPLDEYLLNKDFEIANYLIAIDYDTLGKYKDAYNYYMLYSNSSAQDDEYKQYAKSRADELKEYAK